MSHSRPLVIYVDVDDTLVRSYGSRQIPITGVIERLRLLLSLIHISEPTRPY